MFSCRIQASMVIACTALVAVACAEGDPADDSAGAVSGAPSDTVVAPTTGGGVPSNTSNGSPPGNTGPGGPAVGGPSTSGPSPDGVIPSATGSATSLPPIPGVGGAGPNGGGGPSAGGMDAAGPGPSAMGGASGGVSVGGMGPGGTSAGGTSVGGMSAGGTSAGGMSAGGMSTGGTGPGGSGDAGAASGGASAEDLDMTPEDFACIGDWDQVLGFRITNLLGHLDEALAVAQSATGGVYPPGTVIQHLPTEAMVKRATGFSPETKDWEFFLLELSPDGVTTITERGTTEIMTAMGQTCASCHSMAADEFDFVCNTWAEQSGSNCGFDFGEAFLDMQLATDTRCQ